MKANILRLSIVVMAIWGSAQSSSFAIEDFATHPVFQKFVGKWQGTGSLDNASDGSQISVTEDWEGSIEGESLVMKGHRKFGDSEQEFKWTFTWNSTLELIEGHYYSKDNDTELDFPLEVSVSEVDNTVTISGQFDGQGGPLITVVNTVEASGKVSGAILLENDSGDAIISGTLLHEKTE